VADLLVASFHDIFDYEYTARMESHLDRIESVASVGMRRSRVLRYFAARLATAQRKCRLKALEEPTDEICEKCGSKMVIRWAIRRFMACSGYPNARTRVRFPRQHRVQRIQEEEEEACESAAVHGLETGRFGEFWPARDIRLRNTRKSQERRTGRKEPDVILTDCPTCGKNLVVKHGRYVSTLSAAIIRNANI